MSVECSEKLLLPQVGQAEQASCEAHRKVSIRHYLCAPSAHTGHASMPSFKPTSLLALFLRANICPAECDC